MFERSNFELHTINKEIQNSGFDDAFYNINIVPKVEDRSKSPGPKAPNKVDTRLKISVTLLNQ